MLLTLTHRQQSLEFLLFLRNNLFGKLTKELEEADEEEEREGLDGGIRTVACPAAAQALATAISLLLLLPFALSVFDL